MSSIKSLIEDAIKDPTLASTIDVDKLLEVHKENQGKTTTTIMKEIVDILGEHIVASEQVELLSKKLLGYQYIDQICDIRLGRFVRWIKRGSGGNLCRGGIVTSIQIEDSGVKLLCQNVKMGFSRLRWEDCVLFQQLSLEEQMIMKINESL